MVRREGLPRSVQFYHEAVGLSVLRVTDDWAELSAGPTTILNLQAVSGEAQVSTGYSPLLSFHVSNLDQSVADCVQAGGTLDGPVQFPAHGKVAALRTPDGHMIGLYEPAT